MFNVMLLVSILHVIINNELLIIILIHINIAHVLFYSIL